MSNNTLDYDNIGIEIKECDTGFIKQNNKKMNDFHDIAKAEMKEDPTVRDVLSAVGHYSCPKKYKELFSFVGTAGELKNKLKI
jgi:hypothetical protein